MFCSHCGKTLDPTVANCPHCGAPLGESRMAGHTSVQQRYSPREQKGDAARYTPYTKTTYTSIGDTGEDVYSRTAYRPVLAVDNAQGEAEGAKDAADGADGADAREEEQIPVFTSSSTQAQPHQVESLKKLSAVPDDAPPPDEAQAILEKELDIRVSPLKPIRKTGISPEVEGYIQRMEALKNKGRKKKGDDGDSADEAVEAEQDVLGEIPLVDDNGEPLDEKTQEKLLRRAEKEKKRALNRTNPMNKWVKRIAAVAAICVVIVGGLVYLATTTQPKSPIPGVSLKLYEDGMKLIEERTGQDYRREIVNLFKSDMSGKGAEEKQKSDLAQINSLAAATPQEHDATFISALVGIQEAVNVATLTDAMATLSTDEQMKAEMSERSAEQWAVIGNYKTRMNDAKDVSDLTAVISGVKEVEPTPEPTPEATPSQYTRLKRKDKGAQVKALQTRLAELGWFTSTKDGAYGTFTQNAVKKFQQAAGLAVDGIASPEMQELLFSSVAPTYTPGARVESAGADQQANTEGTDQAGDAGDETIK